MNETEKRLFKAYRAGQRYQATCEHTEDLMELIAQFGVLIGTRWDDIYDKSGDSVETVLFAKELAEGFLALWESGYLDREDSWLEHIDEYFDVWLRDYLGTWPADEYESDDEMPTITLEELGDDEDEFGCGLLEGL